MESSATGGTALGWTMALQRRTYCLRKEACQFMSMVCISYYLQGGS